MKNRKSRDTWSNRQIWLGLQNEAGQRLTEFCQENTLVIANTSSNNTEKTLHLDITRWSIPKTNWLYPFQPKMEKLYTFSKNKTRSRLWLRSWTAYWKFRLKLKKVGESTRPLMYDPNKIPYEYIVEVKNRLKGLDLIECLKNYGRRFVT